MERGLNSDRPSARTKSVLFRVFRFFRGFPPVHSMRSLNTDKKSAHGWRGKPTDHDRILVDNSAQQRIRGIATPSVGIILVRPLRQTTKRIWARKEIGPQGFARRSLRRRCFCSLIFLPIVWLRPQARPCLIGVQSAAEFLMPPQ